MNNHVVAEFTQLIMAMTALKLKCSHPPSRGPERGVEVEGEGCG